MFLFGIYGIETEDVTHLMLSLQSSAYALRLSISLASSLPSSAYHRRLLKLSIHDVAFSFQIATPLTFLCICV
jgi:hypothetical protein